METVIETKKPPIAINQPPFEVRNFRENRPTYAIGGAMVWKNKSKRMKTYPEVQTKSVRIRQGGFVVREEIFKQSRELFEQTNELIPVALDAKNVLVNGYEQYLIAVENGNEFISYIPVKITEKEKRKRHKKNLKNEKQQRYNARKKQSKKQQR